MNKKIDIIVTYFNTDYLVDKSIPALLDTKGYDINLCIVDNTQCSSEMLKRKFNDDRVMVVKGQPQPKRYSRGRHHPLGLEVGLSKTNAEYVALFHCDSWPLNNKWAIECMPKLESKRVDLVGLQHESSLHHSFHLFKRSILSKYNYHYDVRKRQFNKDVFKYVKHPELFTHRRTKWDWGEDLSVRIHESGNCTIGLKPTSACFPFDSAYTPNQPWHEYKMHGFGIIYGNMVCHVWRSYKNCKRLIEYTDFYTSNEYLKNTYSVVDIEDKFVLNDGVLNNTCYLETPSILRKL